MKYLETVNDTADTRQQEPSNPTELTNVTTTTTTIIPPQDTASLNLLVAILPVDPK